MSLTKIGTLYVVATPIGNLQDITLRALQVLKKVDMIVAEDTRHAMPLLKHYSIHKPILSMHDFNERERMTRVIQALQAGNSVAIISDAGTPLISDPGFCLVREAKKLQLPVVPVPGSCAAIAALSVSGLPADKFVFEGFLPAKQKARCHHLASLLHESRTMIFYEAPHRLLAALKDMQQIFGDKRKAAVARELTKVYETVINSCLPDLLSTFEKQPNTVRGEIVILVEGETDNKNAVSREVLPKEVLDILLAELSLKQAVVLTSKITGERKNILYEKALSGRSHHSFK